MVCSIGGKRMYLWRAVDDEGEVLDLVVQHRRDTEAALKLLASNGNLIKRPFVIDSEKKIHLVGFKEPEWQSALL
jgi:transposase-like protein